MTRRPITIAGLERLYRELVPKVARRPKPQRPRMSLTLYYLISGAPPDGEAWVAGHEIAHTLLSTPWERTQREFHLCDIEACYCGPITRAKLKREGCPDRRSRYYCQRIEAAAMVLSTRWHRAAGREDLVRREIRATSGYDDYIEPLGRSGRRLLARRGLLNLPSTLPTIRAALVAHLA